MTSWPNRLRWREDLTPRHVLADRARHPRRAHRPQLHISARSGRVIHLDRGIGPGGSSPSTGTVHVIRGILNATLAELGDQPVAIAIADVNALRHPQRIATMYRATITATADAL